jgi:hypothetical protein
MIIILTWKIKLVFVQLRVSPFRLKNFFAYKRNKANLDPFHMCFTISLSLSLLFAYFRFKFFASLHLSNFRFEAKQSEAKFKSIFLLFFLFFHFFSLFFAFFCFFRLFFTLNFLLRFDLVIFASKRNKAKRNSSLFFRFFRFFHFFPLFSLFSLFSLFFA